MSKRECNICIGDKTNFITCQYCNVEACNECQQKYILERSIPNCMNCKKEWTYNWLREHFPKNFMNKTYKLVKENQLFEIEKTMLPSLQKEVSFEMKYGEELEFYEDLLKRVTKCKKISNYPIDEVKQADASNMKDLYGFYCYKLDSKFIGKDIYSVWKKWDEEKDEIKRKYNYAETNYVFMWKNESRTLKAIIRNIKKIIESKVDLKALENHFGNYYNYWNIKYNQKTNVVVGNIYFSFRTQIWYKYVYRFFKDFFKVEVANGDDYKENEIVNPIFNLYLDDDNKMVLEFLNKDYMIVNEGVLEFLMMNSKNKKSNFSRPCPKNDCRGFFDNRWKCGLCESKVCKNCHEVIIHSVDEEKEHTCNPDIVKSVKAMERETKSCPKCNILTYKISGCFAKDTEIPLYNGGNGECKMSQDIQVGDGLIGDDGEKRNVLELVTGEDEMYKIVQENGVDFIVNSKHDLVLYSQKIDIIYYMTVEEYLEIPWGPFKEDLFCYKTPLLNDYNEKEIRISKFTVIPLNRDVYYGWRLDGNERFIFNDGTVTKNCSQIWCTQCHTTWDWESGEIEKGRIHNPHYWEFMRQQGKEDEEVKRQFGGEGYQQPPQNQQPPVDECFTFAVCERYLGNSIFNNIFQIVNHLEIHDLNKFRVEDMENLNYELRKSYLKNTIDEKKFKSHISMKFKRNNFNLESRQIIEMYLNTIKDTVLIFFQKRGIQKLKSSKLKYIDTTEVYKNLENLRRYVLSNLEKVCEIYGYVVPAIESLDEYIFDFFNRSEEEIKKTKKNDMKVLEDSINFLINLEFKIDHPQNLTLEYTKYGIRNPLYFANNDNYIIYKTERLNQLVDKLEEIRNI